MHTFSCPCIPDRPCHRAGMVTMSGGIPCHDGTGRYADTVTAAEGERHDQRTARTGIGTRRVGAARAVPDTQLGTANGDERMETCAALSQSLGNFTSSRVRQCLTKRAV